MAHVGDRWDNPLQSSLISSCSYALGGLAREEIVMLTEDIVGIIVGVPGVVVALAVFLRYHLKKKELMVREKELELRGSDPELGPDVDALRDDLNDTRAQLADMQERLDFAERLLAAGRVSQEDRSG